MADYFFHSDTDESAVEEILAEAMDHCVLKQVVVINSSSFSHSVLPSHLESRFQRLKTFPSSSKPKPQLAPDSPPEFKDSAGDKAAEKTRVSKRNSSSGYVSSPSDSSNFSSEHDDSSKFNAKSSERKVTEGKLLSGSESFRSNSSNCSAGDADSPKMKAKSSDGKVKDKKIHSRSFSFRSNSSNSSSGQAVLPKLKPKKGNGMVKEGKPRPGSVSFRSDSSDSPSEEAGKSGCFWCSPKKVSRKKSVPQSGVDNLGLDWGKDDDILSALKSFSSKEQQKMMKKAMKEQEKINKEAEKIVKWAKQTSARLDFSGIDDEYSDDDDSGHHFGLH